jgi:type VI protein secretion system component Hcp
MTIKTKSQTPAAGHTDNQQILTEGELDRVMGGRDTTKVHVSEIVVTKKMDSASRQLLSDA